MSSKMGPIKIQIFYSWLLQKCDQNVSYILRRILFFISKLLFLNMKDIYCTTNYELWKDPLIKKWSLDCLWSLRVFTSFCPMALQSLFLLLIYNAAKHCWVIGCNDLTNKKSEINKQIFNLTYTVQLSSWIKQ